MISVYLQGGLGNRMFQIATAYSHSLDVSDDFGVDFKVGFFDHKGAYEYKDNIFLKIKEIDIKKYNFNIYNEIGYVYKQIPNQKDLYLRGYFQSDKYFNKHRNEILNLFINDDIIDDLKNEYKNELNYSIGVHVRRGDYVIKQQFHPVQTIEYYLESIKKIENEKKIKNIFIFSDDINWCKNNFIGDKFIFINDVDFKDMYLMSLCENNIGSNSTFSWWGSWLNKNVDKMVFLPKRWFGPVYSNWNTKDLYFEKTILL